MVESMAVWSADKTGDRKAEWMEAHSEHKKVASMVAWWG